MSAKRLYRAIAIYGDWTATRHFQTKRARDNWAAQRREGYEGHSVGFEDWREPIPPAIRVEIADSEPVVFP